MAASVRVNHKAAQRVARGHPWIFASDVVDRGEATPGDAVRVVDTSDRLLGTAHYSSTSEITLRMLDRRAVAVDAAFFRKRLEDAAAHRRRVVESADAYRLVHGEADFLPGLIVDRYADCLVMQALDQGMDRATETIAGSLEETFAPRAIVARNDAGVRRREGLPLEKRVLRGAPPETVVVNINGLLFHADLPGGQKTGLYLDQRENYAAVARYARGRALDCFTSGGGFALHMARCADRVEGVDSSEPALALARRNAEANGIANVEFRAGDVFDVLAAYAAGGRRFETIVVDPPAFAKSRVAVEGALRGYRNINARALRLLAPGGVLATCSCSHHVGEAMLIEAVAAAARDAGRLVRVLEKRTQARDHPVLLAVPETRYLKCLILEAI
jgi:23S rRNA (cytosine1962-C5)-methyltransferase